ncbi:hypothetical protein JCM10296v2_001313 [Rhodotorula toruloides]
MRLLVRLRRQDVACFVVHHRLDYVSRSVHHVSPCSNNDLAPDHFLDPETVDDAQNVFFRFVHDVFDQGCRYNDAQGLDDDAKGLELDAQGFLDEESFDDEQEAVDQDLVTGPGQIVTVTETRNLPSPSAPTNRPGQGWECSGSGKDGWDVDWQGNECPSHLPSGWKWWGVSIGWGPSKGWDCGSNWTLSPVEVDACSKSHWWTPPPSLRLPSGVECPAGWTSIGWIDRRRPSPSWTCDGTGRDGYDFDHYGNGRPSHLPVGWKWFGQRHGWQPCSSFQLPSSTWSPPSSWNPSLAIWWQPRGAWTLRGNFRCPRWWNRGHLRGSFRSW